MPAFVDVSGTWRHLIPYVNISGAWRQIPQIYINVNNTWRPLWTYSWSLGGWGGCSASCGGGTQTRSVTCVRNDGVVMPDAVCAKLVGAKPATSQACNTQSCVSCQFVPNVYGVAGDWDNMCNVFYVNGVDITASTCGHNCTYLLNNYPGNLSDTCGPYYKMNDCRNDGAFFYVCSICGPF